MLITLSEFKDYVSDNIMYFILYESYIMKIFNIYVKKKNDGLRVDLWVFCEKSIFRPSRSDSFLFISTVTKVRVSTNPQIPSNIQKF